MVQINSSNTKLGKAVQLKFTITQRSRDRILLQKIRDYLGCGIVRKHSQDADVLIVTKLSDLTNFIIPFFDKCSIMGVKALDFADFCEVTELMKNKAHLTTEGLEKIRLIKEGMNKGRQ
jgi:hypothetical protein